MIEIRITCHYNGSRTTPFESAEYSHSNSSHYDGLANGKSDTFTSLQKYASNDRWSSRALCQERLKISVWLASSQMKRIILKNRSSVQLIIQMCHMVTFFSKAMPHTTVMFVIFSCFWSIFHVDLKFWIHFWDYVSINSLWKHKRSL